MKIPRAHHLSNEELAGQVLMPAIDLRFKNCHSPEARRAIHALQKFHVGGFIFFNGHPADIRFWSNWLQRESRYPLLLGADLERGLHSVFSQGTILPHPLAFGAADDEQLLKDAAQVMSREARSVGINVIFGPVVDLANEPDNPIVNIRAFHSDPAKVGNYAQAFVKTVQEFEIACVAKHFPGHGQTKVDSHLQLPEVKQTLRDLERVDLLPFRDTLAAGVKGLMAGHLKISDFVKPASLEAGLIQGVIRDRWNYNGVVFTDALNMGAIQTQFTPWQQAWLPLEAGADVLLMPEQIPLLHRFLVNRLQQDRQFRQQVEQAVDRIIALKRWIFKHQPAQPHPMRIYKIVEHPNHAGIAARVAERSITLLHNSKRFPLDLPDISKITNLIFTDSEFIDQPLRHFCKELQDFFEEAAILNNPLLKDIESLSLAEESVVVISLYFRTFAGHPQKLDWQRVHRVMKSLNQKNARLIMFVFGNPFRLNDLPRTISFDAIFLTYSYVKATQIAAFKALCSFIDINAKLPIQLKSRYDRAIKLEARTYRLEFPSGSEWKKVEQVIAKAIEDEMFPGCAVCAAQHGKILINQGYGRFTYEQNSPQVKADTIYDLASLTKVLATTPAIMRLLEQNEILLSHRLDRFYPQLAKDRKAQIKIADLLSHQSGLPAWAPLYERQSDSEKVNFKKQAVIEQILNIQLEYQTGEKSIYSDLGFILLGNIIEKITGISLDVFCGDHIFQPMRLSSFKFNPSSDLRKKIPPTGRTTDAKVNENNSAGKESIQGVVNDLNCRVMGGIAGHAGLFGIAADVAAIGQLFIQKGIYDARRLFKQATVERFSKRYHPQISARTLGWDTPTPNSSSGRFFSQNSIGHLGFTGTSMWVDLDKEIIVVILSNRVHPDPKKQGINKWRPRLHDVIMESILKT